MIFVESTCLCKASDSASKLQANSDRHKTSKRGRGKARASPDLKEQEKR